MKIDMNEVLTMIGGKPFLRQEEAESPLPLRIGDVLLSALQLPPQRDERRSAKESIQRSRLAERIYDALEAEDGTVEVSSADQTTLLKAAESSLGHPRALAEAIRIIDPVLYANEGS